MSSTMTLYQSNASPNSRRVRLYLAEKGISIPVVPVDVSKKEQFSDAYAAINPRRLVPTLVLGDGTSIGEVLALAISRGVVKVRKINQNPQTVAGAYQFLAEVRQTRPSVGR